MAAKVRRVGVGEPAPDVTLPVMAAVTGDPAGDVSLRALAGPGERPVLLVFLRSLGSPACFEHVAQLRRRQDDLDGTGVAVYVVALASRGRVGVFVRRHALPYPVIVDEARVLYRAFGMGRSPWWRIYAPRAVWRYVKSYLGATPAEPRGETLQRGGDVILDPDGRVQFIHVADNSYDHPAVDHLLRRLHAIPRVA